MKRFISVGLGTFGAHVARTLNEKGHEVIAIDIDETRVDDLGPQVTSAVVGDARDKDTLEQIGAGEADVGVISTGDDMTASILAAMALQDLGVEVIYVKVISEDHARIMEKLGVRQTVLPERDTAQDLAIQLARGGEVRKYVHLGHEFSIQEMAVPEDWIGQTLRTLDLHRTHRITVIARHDTLSDTLTSPPEPDTELKQTDTLLVAGRDDNLRRVAEM
jgi:trk system potassium uptake protein TrkA